MNSNSRPVRNDKVYVGQPSTVSNSAPRQVQSEDNSSSSAADVLTFVVAFIVVLVILTLILQVSWNASIPSIFGLPPVDFVQTLGLLIVSSMLLKR